MARARGSEEDWRRAREVIARLTLVAVDGMVLRAAAEIEPVELRSLDAIHLATALGLSGDLEAFVSYDRRLNAAATELGLPVLSPR